MKDLFQYIGVLVITTVLIVGAFTKLMPLTEEVQVVELKPGIECAIASRLAIVSIDCWKVNTSPSLSYNSAQDNGIATTEKGGLVYIAGGEEVYREEPNLSSGDPTTWDDGSFFITPQIHSALIVSCGEGEILVDYGTGEAIFTHGCDLSGASKALWEGIKPLFDLEIRGGN